MKRQLCWPVVAVLVAALATSSCAWLRYRTAEPPEVMLARADLVEFSMSAQRFELALRMRNPNDFDLPVSGFDYQLAVDDKPVASGRSTRAVTLPAGAEATVPVAVEANLIESGVVTSFRQVQAWQEAGGAEFAYTLSGNLKLSDVDRALPFERSGTVYVDLSDW